MVDVGEAVAIPVAVRARLAARWREANAGSINIAPSSEVLPAVTQPACVAMLVQVRETGTAASAAALASAVAVPQSWYVPGVLPVSDAEQVVMVQATVPVAQQRRGRVRVRAAAQKKKSTAEPSGSAAAALHGMLESKAETRRSKVVRSLGAAGAANLAAAPSRAELGEGGEGGDAFEELMAEFVDENMHARAVQSRRLDRRDCELGLFGDYCARS